MADGVSAQILDKATLQIGDATISAVRRVRFLFVGAPGLYEPTNAGAGQ